MSTNNTNNIINRLPQSLYNVDGNTKLKSIINSIVQEFNQCIINTDRINNMIGIDNTDGQDLYYRWGSLVMIPRNDGESDESYRARLKLSITQLSGGTKSAIAYSIAVGMNINNTNYNDRILVYDAWDYLEPGNENAEPGNIVCLVDLDNQIYSSEMETIVRNSVNNVKAAGINVIIVFSNYRLYKYNELDALKYISLDTLKYSDIGGND